MQPIKELQCIEQIKANLAGRPRDLALFVFGINTAFRASDILGLDMGIARKLKPGEPVVIREQKTGKRRPVTINPAVFDALQPLLATRRDAREDEPVFVGARGATPGECITVCTLGKLVKKWCSDVGLTGDYSSHSLRKTFAYHQRKTHGIGIEMLQEAFGHSSGRITLNYACVQGDELRDMYMTEI
jgi:integrase